ncbi:hypothetical protein [Pseudomonas guariconensis]|uniref:hypothetical protein n=1 Tax=Pseudomonas guariconensis TaxID=1288410 RepID=UPI001E418D66|nr:hypothetical protein [Pseudomonas guariconensis]
MNAFNEPLERERRKRRAIDRWFTLFDDHTLRQDCPSTYHETLLRQADEMDRLGLLAWTEWRDLRRLADRAFLRAVAGADYHPATPLRVVGSAPGTCPAHVHARCAAPAHR